MTDTASDLTLDQLREFAKQPGCERYGTDSERIKLLADYFWVRQLSPELTFEVYLQRLRPLADFDGHNLKHPADALAHHCPRHKKIAETAGVSQWSARQVVDIMALYVDCIKLAERQGKALVPFKDFLQFCGPDYLTGELPPPERTAHRPPSAAAKSKRGGDKAAGTDPATGVTAGQPIRPWQNGQRVIYEVPGDNGRQVKGVAQEIKQIGDRSYVDFLEDDGQLRQDCNWLHFTVIDEQPPAAPAAEQVAERVTLKIPAAALQSAQVALELTTPMGNVDVDDVIYSFVAKLPKSRYEVDISVINGGDAPYVDAQLVEPDPANSDEGKVLAHVDPRQSLLGEYRFQFNDCYYIVEVIAR